MVEIANTLRVNAGRGEIIARWGGDEFMFLCPYGDERSTTVMHRRVTDSLELLSLRMGIRVSASIGTAVFPDEGIDLDDLMHSADKRMYMDKDQLKDDINSSTIQQKLQA